MPNLLRRIPYKSLDITFRTKRKSDTILSAYETINFIDGTSVSSTNTNKLEGNIELLTRQEIQHQIIEDGSYTVTGTGTTTYPYIKIHLKRTSGLYVMFNCRCVFTVSAETRVGVNVTSEGSALSEVTNSTPTLSSSAKANRQVTIEGTWIRPFNDLNATVDYGDYAEFGYAFYVEEAGVDVNVDMAELTAMEL